MTDHATDITITGTVTHHRRITDARHRDRPCVVLDVDHLGPVALIPTYGGIAAADRWTPGTKVTAVGHLIRLYGGALAIEAEAARKWQPGRRPPTAADLNPVRRNSPHARRPTPENA